MALARGRLRIPVTLGVFFGIFMGVFVYWWSSPAPLAPTAKAVGVAVGGAVAGVAFGILVAVIPSAGGWLHIRQLSGLPPSDRVAVLRAVREGEPVSDPRLAPGVLAYAQVVVASTRKQQDRHTQWWVFAFTVFSLVLAVAETITGRVVLAVFFWAAVVMRLTAEDATDGHDGGIDVACSCEHEGTVVGVGGRGSGGGGPAGGGPGAS